MHVVAKTLNLIRAELADEFYERDEAIFAILLALLAKEHVYIHGLPGTGKSALARAFFERILNIRYFEQLLSKTRADAAVLGPQDLPLLRTTGDYKRKSGGYLPTANFAFLDEIGKMSPTLGHELLAIMNERLLHEVNTDDSGETMRSILPVPLYTVVGAANEYIVNESSDAAALWDRMLVRVVVEYIKEPNHLIALLTRRQRPAPTSRTTIDFAELAAAIDNDVPAVEITPDVALMVVDLQAKLHQAGIVPSDRRLEQSMKLLQASAFLDGRVAVDESDLEVLRFSLWDVAEQIPEVQRLVLSVGSPITQACSELLSDLQGLRNGFNALKGKSLVEIAGYTAECGGKIGIIKGKATALAKEHPESAGKTQPVIDAAELLFRDVVAASTGKRI